MPVDDAIPDTSAGSRTRGDSVTSEPMYTAESGSEVSFSDSDDDADYSTPQEEYFEEQSDAPKKEGHQWKKAKPE